MSVRDCPISRADESCYTSAVTNPERDLVLRRGPHLWVVDGIATILVAALLAESVNPVVGGMVVILGAVLALYRPAATLRTTGLVLRGVEIPWRDITAVRTVDGFRTRSVQVFVASTHTWRTVPPLVTSLVLPGAAYRSGMNRFEGWLAEHSPSTMWSSQRWGPAWIWPAGLAVVLAVPLSTQEPWLRWLPRPEADHVPQRCELAPATAQRLGVAADATDTESPLVPGARACLRRGDNRILVTDVEVYHRSWLNSGVTTAETVYALWRVDIGVPLSEEDPAPRPGPLPADEVSTTGYTSDMRNPVEGVYVVARRANVVVFIGFSPDHPTVAALFNRNQERTHYSPGTHRLNARPDDLAAATQVANDILSAVTVH
jgi:hypothetical protein